MTALSRAVLGGAFLAILGACQTAPVPAPSVVAPYPVTYTCSQLQQMAKEYAALPQGSMLAVAIDDYRATRAALRAVHGLGAPTCA